MVSAVNPAGRFPAKGAAGGAPGHTRWHGAEKSPGHPAAALLRPQSSPPHAVKAASQHPAKAPAAEPAFKSSLFGFSTSFNESQIY